MRRLINIALVLITLTSCTIETDGQLNWLTDIAGAQGNDQQEPELMAYLDEYVAEANERGIDLSYVYDHNIQIRFSSTVRTGVAGVSYGLGDDRAINILISERYWERLTDRELNEAKRFLMFHELSHDILNRDHDHTTLMETPHNHRLELMAERGQTWDDVLDEIFN